jgi:hypothetical protein
MRDFYPDSDETVAFIAAQNTKVDFRSEEKFLNYSTKIPHSMTLKYGK